MRINGKITSYYITKQSQPCALIGLGAFSRKGILAPVDGPALRFQVFAKNLDTYEEARKKAYSQARQTIDRTVREAVEIRRKVEDNRDLKWEPAAELLRKIGPTIGYKIERIVNNEL